MKVFSLAMVFATLAVVATGPVIAGSTVADKNYENIQQEWDKARAAGGYGIPLRRRTEGGGGGLRRRAAGRHRPHGREEGRLTPRGRW